MIARRFTIVCLLVSLFGMVFAILVAEASRTPRSHLTADALPCLLDQKNPCRSIRQD